MEIVKVVALAMIRAYQITLSPVLPPACRFQPTCSHYTYEAISKHGVLYGMYLGARRILRCHPFCSGGYDPVPEEGLARRHKPTHSKNV